MYNNYRELMYVGLIFGVNFFLGALFKEYTNLFIESELISRKVAYILGIIVVCILIYVGIKKEILPKIRIDFDEINLDTMFKSTLMCLLCTILGVIFTIFLLSFSDSAWVVSSNINSDNGALSLSEKIVYLFATAIGAPVVEELVFRGVLIGILRKYTNVRTAIIISAIIFGILHFTSISVIFNAIVMGLAFGYMYVKKDNLALSMTMHAILNCAVVMKSYFGLL